jgi:hypothetical protein
MTEDKKRLHQKGEPSKSWLSIRLFRRQNR